MRNVFTGERIADSGFYAPVLSRMRSRHWSLTLAWSISSPRFSVGIMDRMRYWFALTELVTFVISFHFSGC